MREQLGESSTFVMLQIAMWIRGTLFQGERLLETHSSQLESKKYDRTVSAIEEEFFVVAARKLVRWVETGKMQGLLEIDTFPQLRALAPLIIDVRDMREHADDYILRKKGRKQREFYHVEKAENGDTLYSSDATATMIVANNYLIGGRLSVQAVIVATVEARAAMLAAVAHSNHWRWIQSVLG